MAERDDTTIRGGRSWLDRLGLLFAATLAAGLLFGWLRLLPALGAFYLFGLGGLAATGLTVLALIQLARGYGFGTGRVLAFLATVTFLSAAWGGSDGPMTNDFTTDLDEPPMFEHATTLPANEGREMGYRPEFAAEQRRCCSDLAAVHLSVDSARAFERALRAARAMPDWRITWDDPASGRIEAVATTRIFGFRDDVAIRIRRDGAGRRVDVRSKSRDGRGDLGANAARIRSYAATLEQTP